MQSLYYFSKSRQQFVEIRNSFKRLLLMCVLVFIVSSTIISGLIIIYSEFINSANYAYLKSSLNSKIIKAINNDADLKVIKQIYINREEDIAPPKLFRDKKEVYSKDISMSMILDNIRSGLFLNEKAPDSVFLKKLDLIAFEHSQTNPFDKLSGYQKELFQNIRQKLGDSFSSVSNDIIKISDEMYNKNILLDEYLLKSNVSFWISILALIITILLSSYQIYKNRLTHKELLDSFVTPEIKTSSPQVMATNSNDAVI